jgi:hypothetical protein
MLDQVKVTKHDVRWELAHISNRLNKLIKESSEVRQPSVYIELHELRARRDSLMEKLKTL